MGIYDRDYYRDDRRPYWNRMIPEGGVCKFLIVAQVALFVLQYVTFQTESDVSVRFGLNRAAFFEGEVWRFLTFGFLQPTPSPWMLLFNLFWLWQLGSDIEQMYGAVEFLIFYLVSIAVSGICFLASSYLQGTETVFMGALGPITAVTILFACHFPSLSVRVFWMLQVPAWMLAIIEVAGASILAWRQDGIPAIIACTVFAGLYYKKQWRLSALFQGWSSDRTQTRARTSKLRVYDPEEDDAEPVAVAAPKPSTAVLDEHLEAKVDALLEKMARSGKESLSDSERQILLQASEIYRKKRT